MPTLLENIDKVVAEVVKDDDYYVEVSSFIKRDRLISEKPAFTLEQLHIMVAAVKSMPVDAADGDLDPDPLP